MSLDLTLCGHLRTDSNGNLVFCDKCRPASQKQAPLTDEQATTLVMNTLSPHVELWLKSGKITPGQAAGNIMGIGIAIAVQAGLSREPFIQLIEECYGATEDVVNGDV